ncbi:MAG: hypothetical protein H5U02_08040 [Clostridia bacterium]|nr:hypothetical protein [Clostridia bacterium]
MLLGLVAGLVFGTSVSVINHIFITWLLRRIDFSKADQAKGKVLGGYAVRYAVNFLALLAVYHNLPVLMGTGLGLTMMKNVLAVRYLLAKGGE